MTDPYVVRPLQRAIEVLRWIGHHPGPSSLKEIATATGLPKTTAFRYLRTFVAAGLLVHERERDLYRLDARSDALTARGAAVERLREAALPQMRALRRAFDETVNLAVLEGTDVVYVEIVDGARGLRSLARVGGRHPAHSTAVGKAMLAHMDEVSRSASLPRVLRRRTGRTHVDARRLADELAAVAAAGHAIEVGENEEGAACVGVPVIGLRGEVSGALSIAVPSARLAPARTREMVRGLVASAAAVARERADGR